MRASHSAVAVLLLCGAAARAQEDTSPPVISHTPVTRGERGKPTQLTARITDESKTFPQVFYRFTSSGSYEKPVDMKPVKGQKSQWTATLPPPPGNVLDYYIEAYDEFGNGPARAGDPDKPFRIDFAPVQIVQTQPTAPASTDVASSAGPGRGRFWAWIVGGTGLGLLAGGIVANPLGSPRATALDVAGATLLAGSVALYFLEAPRDGSAGAPPRGGPRGPVGMAAGPISGGGAVCVAGRF